MKVHYIYIFIFSYACFTTETMDYGYPQLVTPDLLKEFIKIGSVQEEYRPKVCISITHNLLRLVLSRKNIDPKYAFL